VGIKETRESEMVVNKAHCLPSFPYSTSNNIHTHTTIFKTFNNWHQNYSKQTQAHSARKGCWRPPVVTAKQLLKQVAVDQPAREFSNVWTPSRTCWCRVLTISLTPEAFRNPNHKVWENIRKFNQSRKIQEFQARSTLVP